MSTPPAASSTATFGPTPLLHSLALSDQLGCDVYLKCENLQPVGAFKVRGGST